LLAHHLAILLDSKSLGPCGGIIPTKYGSLTPTRAIEAKGKTTASKVISSQKSKHQGAKPEHEINYEKLLQGETKLTNESTPS
jgi:hypothetical protein